MSEPLHHLRTARRASPIASVESAAGRRQSADDREKVLCERCNAEMYRMHAIWRCSICGFKTDCVDGNLSHQLSALSRQQLSSAHPA